MTASTAPLVFVLLLALATVTHAAETQRRTYTQTIAVQYASPEAAQQAAVTVAPVYDNRKWAFSARWDDNNANSLNMHAHMARLGLKGTFYLTNSAPQAQFGLGFLRELTKDGFSVGGHSVAHRKLAELSAGEAFGEVLANRVQREAQGDVPLNSYAFAYGQYQTPDNPQSKQVVSEVMQRSGYHHCVYEGFVRNNPFLRAEDWLTGLQVVPGDRVVEADKFHASVQKILQNETAYGAVSRCLFLGVHAWQQGEEWDKFDAAMAEVANRPDWWYCNQTEWTAYAMQARTARLEAEPANGARRVYRLTRWDPCELGAMTPLTLVVRGAEVAQVTVDGQPLAAAAGGEATVLNVPHAPGHAVPARIGAVNLTATTPDAGQDCPDFPGTNWNLTLEREKHVLTLSVTPAEELRNLWVTARLPLRYSEGVVNVSLAQAPAGQQSRVTVPLPPERDEAPWNVGPDYYVVEVDFATPTQQGRVYVTRGGTEALF